MQLMTLTGLAAAILVFFLFGFLWIRETRKNSREKLTAAIILDAAGFGLFPGLAVWKIFEPYCRLGFMSRGKALFDPLGPVFFLTQEERFAPERIELAAILISFAGMVIWMMIRRQALPGNGDVFMTVICIWSVIRIVTETLRENALRIQEISVFMLCAIAAETAVMAIWTIRRGKRQKNAALTMLEWAAILACGVICILQDIRVLSMGSPIVNLIVTAGCCILTAALILSAGKDSREA